MGAVDFYFDSPPPLNGLDNRGENRTWQMHEFAGRSRCWQRG